MTNPPKTSRAAQKVELMGEAIARLERKVDRLQIWVSLQTVLLSVLAVSYLFELTRYLVFLLIVTVPLLIFFRQPLSLWYHRARKLVAFFRRGRDRMVGVSTNSQSASRSRA